METLVAVVHVVIALAIIGLVLLQQGKGADVGASFGAGASQTVFGSAGTGNFLVRATAVAATLFFVTSLALAIFARSQSGLGTTQGLPVVNEDILQEVTTGQSDVPEIVPEATVDPSDLPEPEPNPPTADQDDVPGLPDGD